MTDATTLVLVAAFAGLCIGIVGHRAYILWRIAKLREQNQEVVFTNVIDHIRNNIFIAYSERDEATQRYRMYEVGTNKFLAQGESADTLQDAFFDRYPDKQFVLIHSDERLAEEMGVSLEVGG